MNVVKLSAVFTTTLLMAAGCGVEGETVDTESLEMVMHHCEAEPVMLSGDYDGDGTITAADVAIIEAAKDAGDYAAFWDMTDDGALDGKDVAAVAKNLGSAASPRDAQMLALWNGIQPYRNVFYAIGQGYMPFTPELKGHGVHFANLDLVYGWTGNGGFRAGVPEGLNYSPSGELMAAFYYGLAVTDLHNLNPSVPAGAMLAHIAPPRSFTGVMGHTWHQHTGACFGRASLAPPDWMDPEIAMPGMYGFNQCYTAAQCFSTPVLPGVDPDSAIWSPEFHMLHAWVIKHNECGVFGGVDPTVSVAAPHEPNHGNCELEDLVSTPIVDVPPLF